MSVSWSLLTSDTCPFLSQLPVQGKGGYKGASRPPRAPSSRVTAQFYGSSQPMSIRSHMQPMQGLRR